MLSHLLSVYPIESNSSITFKLISIFVKVVTPKVKVFAAYNFKSLLDDTLLLYKNIQETSLPGKDKEQRLLDLEKRLGVQLRFTR